MSSAWDSFFAATSLLAQSGSIKHRLSEAYRTHLADLHEEDLPSEIREEFSSLSTCMRRVRPQRGESAINATVRKMSTADAGRAAAQIVSMLGVISRVQNRERIPNLRLVNSGDD